MTIGGIAFIVLLIMIVVIFKTGSCIHHYTKVGKRSTGNVERCTKCGKIKW